MSYRDIMRGPELEDAYEKLLVWQRKTRAQKKAAYREVAKAKAQRVATERVDGYILPFNSKSNTIYLETRILADTQTGVGSDTANVVRGLIDDRALKNAPASAGVQTMPVPKYTFAKIIASERTTTATDETPSRKTETPYLRHRSNNVSSPFGRKDAGDSYPAAVFEIRAKAAFRSFEQAKKGNRIGFAPEKG
jgi:hypothetical protein